MPIIEISAHDLNQRLADGQDQLQLIDVREDWEYEHCQIAHSIHVVLHSIPERLAEFDRQKPLVLICHHGVRSLMACQYLEQQGFSNLYNLTGGIDAWSNDVDPTIQKY